MYIFTHIYIHIDAVTKWKFEDRLSVMLSDLIDCSYIYFDRSYLHTYICVNMNEQSIYTRNQSDRYL